MKKSSKAPMKNRINTHERCAICMTEFRITKSPSGFKKRNIIILKCNHKYHTECIKEWCNSSPFCPTCKKVIPNNNLWEDIDMGDEIHNKLVEVFNYEYEDGSYIEIEELHGVSEIISIILKNNGYNNIIDLLNVFIGKYKSNTERMERHLKDITFNKILKDNIDRIILWLKISKGLKIKKNFGVS